MSGWDGDKNDYLTRQRDGRPVVGVRQFHPNPDVCCEACVFRSGKHSPWCPGCPQPGSEANENAAAVKV
jgi:hypothetical protein